MGFCNQFRALLTKNWILWCRNLCGSLCELIFPLVIMSLIILIKLVTTDDTILEHSYLNSPFFYTANESISQSGAFSACLHKNITLIGIVGSSTLYTGLRQSFTELGVFPFYKEKYFSTERDLDNYLMGKDYDTDNNPRLCTAIVISDVGNGFEVKLRYDDDDYSGEGKCLIPTTRNPVTDPLKKAPDETSYNMYKVSGFTYLQTVIAKVILKSKGLDAKLRVGFLPMKAATYTMDNFLSGAVTAMPFIIILCYIVPIFRVISIVVVEKETKVREGMKMMGLKDSAYWTSFFVYYMIISVIISVIFTAISMGALYKYSNWGIMFLFMFLYGMSIFSFGVFLSSFFVRAKVASITGTMLYFASYFLSSIVTDSAISETSKNWASLLPPIAMTLGSSTFITYEKNQYGLDFSNAGNLIENYRFSMCLGMLTIDIILYFFLGLYIENVLPSPTGVRQPFYFFLTKEFWTGQPSVSTTEHVTEDDQKLLNPNKNFDPVNISLAENQGNVLRIRNLDKVFGAKEAVKNFNVDMYSSQIFALLGPNGAGKTTTLSMLTGFLPATRGLAKFNDLMVFQQMAKMREILGVCPQHDVLFDQLTPREHLNIFAAFKGRSGSAILDNDVNQILQDVELSESQDQLAGNLSGGQKRKLSIAIAFVGDSPIIFLDEPTSGMDMRARQGVWEILKKYKKDKVIILTTHYMEEAEVLGDRIGIMTNGTLRCVGSPLFLKSRFNIGYSVTVVKENEGNNETILNFVRSHFPGTKITREASKELTFHIQKSDDEKFKVFFTELDSKVKELKIESYGMASSTLEEVFLKVARGEFIEEEAEENGEGEKLKNLNRMDSISQSANMPLSALDQYSLVNEAEPGACSSFFTHMGAIFLKRLLITMRGWLTLLIELIVPAALIIFGFCLTIIPIYVDGSTRWYNVDSYATPQRVYLSTSASASASVDKFISTRDTNMQFEKTSYSFATDVEYLKAMDDMLFVNKGVDPSRYGSIYIKSFDTANHIYEYVNFLNTTSQDVSAAYNGFFLRMMLRTALSDNNFELKFANSPFPLSYITRNREGSKNGGIVASMLVIAFALVPGSIISYIVKEREDNLKHQQLISGVSVLAYWLSNAAMDLIKVIIPCALSIGLLPAFDISLPYGWLIIILYGIAIIPFTYATSFMFTGENAAQTTTLMAHFLVGVVMGQILILFRIFDSTRQAGKILGWIFRIIPSFALSYGINNISNKKVYAYIEKTAEPDDLSLDCAGGDVMFLCIDFVIYTLLIFLSETKFFSTLGKCFEPKHNESRTVTNKDALVAEEAKQCDNFNVALDPPAILAQHIRKLYRTSLSSSIVAVSDVSFFTKKGECFALLGTNGAGKTTTFKMLTKDVTPTSGSVFINGLEIGENFSKIRRMIGYSPQYEACFMPLTVEENLNFYATIKGIPPSIRQDLVNKIIAEMQLEIYRNVNAENLSGGNKRKLTVAIALIGNPPIVLLDEPSTGVDPQAKRFMWKMIQRISIKNKQTAVILTTHSMEEAEALCTKMAIMVAGNFRCIGTPQQLKENFGKGYEIQINVKAPDEKEISQFIESGHMTSSTKFDKDSFERFLNNMNMPDLIIKDNSQNGYASNFYREFKDGKQVSIQSVVNFISIEKEGRAIAEQLAAEFGNVRIPEHYNNFYKFRLEKSKPTQTIGLVFSMIQDMCKKFRISEYSASQTTLSQIFHTFVQQAEYGDSGMEFDKVIQATAQNKALDEVKIGIEPDLPISNSPRVVMIKSQ